MFAGRGDWAPRKQKGIKKGRAKAVTIATEQRGGLMDGAHVWALGCSGLERLNRISPKLPGPSRVPQSPPLSPMIANTTFTRRRRRPSDPPFFNLKFGPSLIKTMNTNWYFLMFSFFEWTDTHQLTPTVWPLTPEVRVCLAGYLQWLHWPVMTSDRRSIQMEPW